MVVIDSGPLEASNRFRDVPKSKWRSLTATKRDFLAVQISYDCRCLVEFCEEAELAWKELGYESAADMIRNGYELDPVEIDVAVSWLKHNEPECEISLPAVHQKIAEAKAAGPLMPNGTNQHSEGGGDNITPSDRGTAVAYTFRRLMRDAPELAAAVERGELSANAAAIKAGFRKVPTHLEKCQKAWAKMTNDDRERFREWIEHHA